MAKYHTGKYHINQINGNVAPCNATLRPCPHGGEENHFESAEDARKAFEERSSKEAPKTVTKGPGIRLERRAEKYVSAKTWGEVPTKADDETVKNASAYAVVNSKLIPVTYEEFNNPEGFKDLNDYDGSDYLVTGRKDYLIATNRGAFVKVSYKTDVDAQLDDYWEFHPSISATYMYYENFEDLKADKPSGRDQNVELDDSSVFRTTTYYNGRESGNRPSYDHSSSREAIEASKRALRELPKPYEIATLAEVRGFKGKIPTDRVAKGKSYYGSENPAIRVAAVKRKEFPSAMFSEVLKDPSKAVRVALATRDDLDRPTMELLLEDREGERGGWMGSIHDSPRSTVIGNPKLPVRLQNKILKEGSIADLRALDQNQGLTPANREKLNEKKKQLRY